MYTWSKRELELKRILCQLLNKPGYYEHYTSILRQLDLSTKEFNLEDIMIAEEDQNVNINLATARFKTGLEYISEDIYESLIDLYFSFGAYNMFADEPHLNQISINDDDLVALVYDMIQRTGISEFIKIYQKIIDRRRHILNIQNNDTACTTGAIQGIGGITLNDPLFKKSYINIFRTHTIADVEVLFHESMHAIFYELMYNHYKRNPDIRLLHELEGQVGSLYTYQYLRTIGYKNEADILLKDYLDNLLTTTFLLVINHALHVTAKYEEFCLPAASAMINSRLTNKTITLKEEGLPKYTAFYGYENITTLISSLIALEIIEKDATPEEKFILLYGLKKDDSEDIETNMKAYDVDYRKNSYKTLRKVFQELQK